MTMPMRERAIVPRQRSAVVIILVGLIGAGGVALLAASGVSFDLVKSLLDRCTADGHADEFTVELFRGVVTKARLAGGVLLAAAVIMAQWRRSLASFLSTLRHDGRVLLESVSRTLREALRNEPPSHLWSLLLIVGLGVAVRLAFLSQPMRYDESFSFMQYASKPLIIALSRYFPNNHLFHTLLIHVASRLLGDAPWVIRLPAFIAGVLVIPAAYLVVRCFYRSRHAALLTAALVAGSSLLIAFSTAARGYTLVCLMWLLLLLLAAYGLRHANVAAWLLCGVVSALGFYTIPLMFYPFGIVVTWLILSSIRRDTPLPRRRVMQAMLAMIGFTAALTLLLYLPPLIVSGMGSLTTRGIAPAQVVWSSLMAQHLEMLRTIWTQWNRDLPFWLSTLLAAGCAIGVVRHRQVAVHRVPLVLAVLGWCLSVLLIQRIATPERTWLFLLPLYFGVASAGLCEWASRVVPPQMRRPPRVEAQWVAAVSVVLCLWSSLAVIRSRSASYANDAGDGLNDAEQIVLFLKDRLQPGDRILARTPSEAPLEYYLHANGVPVTYLLTGPGFTNRLFVVVKEPTQSLAQLLGPEMLRPPYASPILLKRYAVASVYEVRRRQ